MFVDDKNDVPELAAAVVVVFERAASVDANFKGLDVEGREPKAKVGGCHASEASVEGLDVYCVGFVNHYLR